MKFPVKKILMLCIGLGLMGYLLSTVNLTELKHQFLTVDPLLMLLCCLFSHLQFVISSMKWQLLLSHNAIHIRLRSLVASYLISNFISSFLPSKYSADLFRTYAVARHSGMTYDSAAAVIMERLSGLFVLVVVGLAASLYCLSILDNDRLIFGIMAVCVLILGGLELIFTIKAYEVFHRMLVMLRWEKILRPFDKLHNALMKYKGQQKLFAKIIALSVVFYTQSFLMIYLAARAIHVPVPFLHIVLLIPMIYLIEALPISPQGLGVRESAFVFFFTKVGLTPAQALGISLVIFAYRLITVSTGGLLFALDKTKMENFSVTQSSEPV